VCISKTEHLYDAKWILNWLKLCNSSSCRVIAAFAFSPRQKSSKILAAFDSWEIRSNDLRMITPERILFRAHNYRAVGTAWKWRFARDSCVIAAQFSHTHRYSNFRGAKRKACRIIFRLKLARRASLSSRLRYASWTIFLFQNVRICVPIHFLHCRRIIIFINIIALSSFWTADFNWSYNMHFDSIRAHPLLHPFFVLLVSSFFFTYTTVYDVYDKNKFNILRFTRFTFL